ncbi:MAG: DUF4093 domain-containing protein [Ruminococcaceae bacterium]|nr:DUF4093 domain-containing protein [Oscillospiraceae bacterium]
MLNIKEAIVVEGIYDEIKVKQLVDATVITTNGFRIYNDKKKIEMIRRYAETTGIIIFTDSDRAGFRIRNYVKNLVGNKNVRHAYIPDIKGKEKRKSAPSKEGFLGVEGVSDADIVEALKNAGFTQRKESHDERLITKADLFADGLSGNNGSSERRLALLKKLQLPEKISTNMMLDVLNDLYGYDEYKKMTQELK